MIKSIHAFLTVEHERYLDKRKQHGGTASGFREAIGKALADQPTVARGLMNEAWMEAATKKWEQQPRKRGPDLFSINAMAVPEFLTRTAEYSPPTGDEIEAETYEKVAAKYATVADRYSDATIKLRNAAQASAAAELAMKQADEARRRAKGNLRALLKDLAD